jgi:hypothetical protein
MAVKASGLAALALFALTAGGLGNSAPAVAQGLASGKFCTVVRSCNFKRGAAVRGCLSSYSCRQCDFRRKVRRADGRIEWRSTCDWGPGS